VGPFHFLCAPALDEGRPLWWNLGQRVFYCCGTAAAPEDAVVGAASGEAPLFYY
jgi:hypothetical protein